jgi:riboflavin kinase/FMN adenylyltransferase
MDAHVSMMIGNFDGVHLGHRALVAAARTAVGADGRVMALALDPHPAAVLRPGAEPPRLSTRGQRTAWLLDAGCDEVLFVEPTAEFLSRTPESFIGELVSTHRPAWIVEGSDFRFGRDRAGDLDLLRALGGEHGFEVVEVPEVHVRRGAENIAVHSRAIRQRLVDGGCEDAACMLGRPYTLQGPVVSGDRRGRELGMPTANLDHGDMLLPADGIYAGTACDPDGCIRRAAISVGTKPTFKETPRVCEVHLVDHVGPVDDYGWTMTVHFQLWLRGQVAYEGVEPLREQLQQDLEETRRRVDLQPQGE